MSARLVIILSNLLAAAGAYGYGRTRIGAFDGNMALLVETDHYWLGLLTALYAINFVVAWRFKDTWLVSASRMILWAIIAYFGISHLVDLVGQNFDVFDRILAFGSDTEAPSNIIGLRARVAAAVVMVTMPVTCIAIGFETKKDKGSA